MKKQKLRNTKMKTWQYLKLIVLLGLFGLTTCKQKETGPFIDEALGEYDALGESTGVFDYQEVPKVFTVTKSNKADNLLNIRLEFNKTIRIENWEVKFLSGGRLVMDRQIVDGTLDRPKIYQEASGRFTGDSLILGGRRYYTYIIADEKGYLNYRAKKKR
jgi:hypothetical protein